MAALSQTGVSGDQTVVETNHTYEIETRVAEMGSVEIGLDIPIDQGRMEKIKARDDDPKFVVVEIESCEKANGTSQAEWGGDAIRSIAEQVNKKRPVGYKGHIPEQDNGTAFPPVQAVWLGAAVAEKAGKTIARIKGYLMPNAEMRDYVELEAVDGVSVRGDATMSRKTGGGWKVKEFMLESIDFARKGKSGMPTRIVALTSEMEGGSTVEPKDIAALDENELRSHNPLLVDKIEKDARAELDKTVSEMTAAADAAEPKVTAFDEICEKLGIKDGENPVDRVVALMDQVTGAAKAQVKGMVDAAIVKVAGKNEQAQKIIRRLVGEQVVDEFADRDPSDDGLAEEIEAKVSEMAENDEDVKAVVSEMETGPKGAGGASLGTRSRTDTKENPADERKSRTGGVQFGKRRVA